MKFKKKTKTKQKLLFNCKIYLKQYYRFFKTKVRYRYLHNMIYSVIYIILVNIQNI